MGGGGGGSKNHLQIVSQKRFHNVYPFIRIEAFGFQMCFNFENITS